MIVPIDKSYRITWNRTSHTRPYQIWTSQYDGGQIYGTIVGVYVDDCIGCMKCIDACPTKVFEVASTPKDIAVPIHEMECIFCLVCEITCPTNAICVDKGAGSDDTLHSLLGGT